MSVVSRCCGWIDARFPMTKMWQDHASHYYAPKNLNFWYYFGVFSMIVLINQIVTGIWLTMYYTPTAAGAFASIEHMMRDVPYGWLLRYMHTTGSSAFFIVVYLHIYRGMMYGSHKAPRELLWIVGMLLFLLLMVEACTGYVLPWGQMSYWATKVMVSVFTVIPGIGKEIAIWIQGDYSVSGITLHRFFSFHVIAIPIIILGMVIVHVLCLHQVGSNNPDGVEIKNKKNASGVPLDGIPFHPYYTVKDWMGVVFFLFVFSVVLFFVPTMHGYFLESANFIPANPLVTPAHIAPPWYLASFYAMLRAVPSKGMGVIVVALAITFVFVMPWLDRSPVRSLRYRGWWSRVALCLFVLSFLTLSVLGNMAISTATTVLSRICVIVYFLFFLLMPVYTRYEKTHPVPERVTK